MFKKYVSDINHAAKTYVIEMCLKDGSVFSVFCNYNDQEKVSEIDNFYNEVIHLRANYLMQRL